MKVVFVNRFFYPDYSATSQILTDLVFDMVRDGRDVCVIPGKGGLADKFVVGYSGNMGRAHEFETVLSAAAILKDRKDFIFLFIGDG